MSIVLDEQYVSQVHCRSFIRDGSVFAADLGSTNGTWVNGQRLKVVDHVLQPNDEITIGRFKLRFEL